MHEIFLKPQYKCAEVPQSSISTHPFSVVLSLLRISQPSGCENQQRVNFTLSLQYYPQGCILSYFYKLLRALSLSRMLVEFSLNLNMPPCVGKIFRFMVSTFLENAFIYIHGSRSPLKTLPQVLIITP